MKRLIHAAFLMLATVGLSACGKTLGPYPVEVKPSQKFELRSTIGTNLTFEADQQIQGVATYVGRKRSLELSVGNQTFAFSGAKYNRKTRQIVASPEKTGQNIGLKISQQLICNPDCEKRETRREYDQCTYYMQDQFTVCHSIPNGGVACHTEWRQIPRSGRQWVERTTVTRQYAVDARLVDRSWIEVAQAIGNYADSHDEVRALSTCF